VEIDTPIILEASEIDTILSPWVINLLAL